MEAQQYKRWNGTPAAPERQPAMQPFMRPPSPRDALDLLEQFGATVSVQRDQEIHGQGEEATSCYEFCVAVCAWSS